MLGASRQRFGNLTKTGPDNDYNPNTSQDGPDEVLPLWTYDYDVNGNLESVTRPKTAATEAFGRETEYTYDPVNLKSSTKQYDSSGALKSTELYKYDNRGNLAAVVDPRGVALAQENAYTTRYEYDRADRQIKIDRPDTTDAAGTQKHVSLTAHDKAGNIVSTTDELGRVTRFTYDALDRQVETLLPSPAGQPRRSVTAYDANGNVIAAVDAVGNVSRSAYDKLDRPTSMTDALDKVTALTYDVQGNLLTLVDPRGVKTRFTYDFLDRRTKEGIQIAADVYDDRLFEYDSASNLTKRTDREGRVTRYEYDLHDRQIAEKWFANAADPTADHTITSAYFPGGELKSISDSFASYAYSYDFAGRMLTENNAGSAGMPAVTVSSQYDAAGNRTRLSNSQQTSWYGYQFDQAGRMTATA